MTEGSLRAVLDDPLVVLQWSVRVKIAQGIASGMEHLHTILSIVHRDLKSPNCLLSGGDTLSVKVADFGTSRCMAVNLKNVEAVTAASVVGAGSASMTRAVGTALWMAPEIFLGTTGETLSSGTLSFCSSAGCMRVYCESVDVAL
jgi:serine/threonine protein kinase